MDTWVDASGVEHELFARDRVVSLVPSTTETVFALESSAKLVGLTRYCVRPPGAARGRVVVGGTKAPRIETIVELAPDLVLANREENRKDDVVELRRSLPVFVFYPRDVGGAIADIRTLGRLLGVRDRGERLGDAIESARAELRPTECFSYLYLIWKEPFMVAGRDTFIDALLSEAGGVNQAPPDRGRYPTMTADELRASEAQTLLLASEPYPFDATDVLEIGRAFESKSVRPVDGQLLSWHGARLRAAFPYLRDLAASLTL